MPPKGCKHTEESKKKMRKPKSKEHKQKISEAQKGNNNSRWKGGISITNDGYVRIYSPNHPNRDEINYVLQHRLIMEKKIGRYLKKEEIVHHINGDKKDNKPDNLLLLLNIGEHNTIHKLYRWIGVGTRQQTPRLRKSTKVRLPEFRNLKNHLEDYEWKPKSSKF